MVVEEEVTDAVAEVSVEEEEEVLEDGDVVEEVEDVEEEAGAEVGEEEEGVGGNFRRGAINYYIIYIIL